MAKRQRGGKQKGKEGNPLQKRKEEPRPSLLKKQRRVVLVGGEMGANTSKKGSRRGDYQVREEGGKREGGRGGCTRRTV